MTIETTRYIVEYTDTFGGSANYSWVRREAFTLPHGASSYKVMRHAKRLMGISNVRGTTLRYGDLIEFRPYKSCTVLFIYEDRSVL